MKKQHKMTISIGISAYNEEKNIRFLLNSIFAQKLVHFSIKEIILISDGSTDKTVQIVKRYDDPRLRIIAERKREGKKERLNEIINKFRGDILVFLDADIILKHKNVLEILCLPFITAEHVGLVSGEPIPMPAITFVERAVRNSFIAMQGIKNKIRKGNNVYSVWGRVLALSRDFAKTLTIPNDAPDDSFIYFSCKRLRYKFIFQKKAEVWFRCPQTVKDQVRQGSRFLHNNITLSKYFDPVAIQKEYKIPNKFLLEMLIKQIMYDPIAYLFMKYMHILCLRSVTSYQSKWQMVVSSKNVSFFSSERSIR